MARKNKEGRRKMKDIDSQIATTMANLYIVFGCPIQITFRATRREIVLLKVIREREEFEDEDDDDDDELPPPLKVNWQDKKGEMFKRPFYIG